MSMVGVLGGGGPGWWVLGSGGCWVVGAGWVGARREEPQASIFPLIWAVISWSP